MPRGKSEGSVYQIKTGRQAGMWRGAVVVGWKDGRPDRVTRTRRTETEAKAALRAVLNDRDTGKLRKSAADWTVGEWMPHWLDVLRADDPSLGESTRSDYRSLIRIWIAPTIGGVRLDRVGERHAEQVDRAMLAKGRSASRRHHVHVILHAALRAAVKKGVLGFNPVAEVDAPTVVRKQVEAPDERDVAAIYATCKGDPLEARWIYALENGTRQGETLGLEWEHVDLDDLTTRIAQQLRRRRGEHGCGDPTPAPTVDDPTRRVWPCGRRWASKCPTPAVVPGLVVKAVKTDRGNRTIPITADTAALLRKVRTQQAQDRLREGDKYYRLTVDPDGAVRRITAADDRRRRPPKELDLVFRRPDGRPINPREDWQAWADLLVEAGRRHTRLHNARHTSVIGWIDAGVSFGHLGRLAGHANDSFTSTVYGGFSREGADAARELMDARQKRLRSGKAKPARTREA